MQPTDSRTSNMKEPTKQLETDPPTTLFGKHSKQKLLGKHANCAAVNWRASLAQLYGSNMEDSNGVAGNNDLYKALSEALLQILQV